MENLRIEDQGDYQCCLSLSNNITCEKISVVVYPHPVNVTCANNPIVPSSPFQINHFHSKPLLKDGQYITIIWHFNISQWKISTRFPQCKKYLLNMEQGMEHWFGKLDNSRSKRDVIDKILGGIGTIGTVANSIEITSLQKDLEGAGLLNSKSLHVQRGLNQILNQMVVKSASVFGPSLLHLQHITLGLLDSENAAQVSRACMEIQTEYSTDFKITAQALQGGITPLSLQNSLPQEYEKALNHSDLWVNKWVGCKNLECIATSLIPIAGEEMSIYSMTVLGIPVSESQLLFYSLTYKDFIGNPTTTKPEQVDLSACLHFNFKILCLPHQIRPIMCAARVENVKTTMELMTPLEKGKICFQIMKKIESVKVLYPTCMAKPNLDRGLYCINNNPTALTLQGTYINIPQFHVKDINVVPIQFNLTVVNEFPWFEWAKQIQEDKGLLYNLQKQLQEAEIIFQHEEGKLKAIEHEYSEMSGSTWWRKMVKSVNMWAKTSTGTVVSNILFHPLIIVFILAIGCIVIQLFLVCRVRCMYKRMKKSINQGEVILREMVNRKC
ncbi:uncharacterized protein LOC121397044 [Xenopus laevis]|uniref:Uncharacterized protein LOC121397044 n=1 Tax=Xenopus laevis TaxID=8355 RepID=A0A8J1LHH0_XENLA|nr:uncharacterized protein LOC121397044 [Xenopus laevis]